MKKNPFRIACIALAFFAMACGAAPLFYGVFHTGTVAAFLFGAGLLLFALLWDAFDGQGKFRVRRCPRPVSGRTAPPGGRPPRRWRRARGLGAAALSLAVIGGGLVSVPMARYAWFNPPDAQRDYTVVVLGCQVLGDRPSVMLRRRLDAALNYLAAHPEAPVVASGGRNDGGRYSEAEVMKLYLTGKGVDPGRIYLEDRSRNTGENIAFSRRVIAENGLPPALAVATDGFHEMRAAIYAGRGGAEAAALPAVTPWGLFPTYWVREWFGIVKALVL